MKSKTTASRLRTALTIAVSLVMLGLPVLAQNGTGTVKTNSRILYHNGPVMAGTSHVYFIWYGNWTTDRPGNNNWTIGVLTDFVSNLGSSRYFQINTLYPDTNGAAPSGGLIYAGAVFDEYSHGPSLTESDIQEIVAEQIAAGGLPLDTMGIYVVIATADVTDINPDGITSYCFPPQSPPRHGVGTVIGAYFKYAFIGNPARCPSSQASQFTSPDGSPPVSPNGDIYADAMASTLAHALATVVTNPAGTGWFDRYGLANANKCQGTFGQTYINYAGGRADMRLGQRDYLIQQNWVNLRKGYCGLSLPE